MNTRNEKIAQHAKEGMRPKDIAGLYHISTARVYKIIKAGNIKQTIKETDEQVVKVEEKTQNNQTDYDMKKLVPKNNGYISRRIGKTTDSKLLENMYSKKYNLLIVGETGCGKTHAVRDFCYKKKLPYKRINLNGGTTAEDLFGQYVPTENNGFKWVDGWMTLLVKNGGVLVLDEINGCSAEILFAIHSLADDERNITITQKDGEIVQAHKDFWLVATMNPDYEGTKPLNVALRDRFRIIEWDYDKKVEEKLKIPDEIIDIAGKLRTMYKQGEITTPVSTRCLIQYKEDLELFDEKTAQYFFLNKFVNSDDKQAVEEVINLQKGSEEEQPENDEGEQNE